MPAPVVRDDDHGLLPVLQELLPPRSGERLGTAGETDPFGSWVCLENRSKAINAGGDCSVHQEEPKIDVEVQTKAKAKK